MTQCNEPHLGLATTRQLLDEIAARIEVDGANGGGGLGYTTVGGRGAPFATDPGGHVRAASSSDKVLDTCGGCGALWPPRSSWCAGGVNHGVVDA